MPATLCSPLTARRMPAPAFVSSAQTRFPAAPGPRRLESVAAAPASAGASVIRQCLYQSTGHGALDFVRPVLRSLNVVISNQAEMPPRQQARSYQLIFVQRGRYHCVLNGQPLQLQPRDLLVVKRGDWHEETLGPGQRYLLVGFDLVRGETPATADIFFDGDVLPEHQVVRGPNPEARQLLDRMQEESRRQDALVGHTENALLLQLFCRIARALPAARLSPILVERSTAQIFSERLHRVFSEHLGQPLTAATIAAKMGIGLRTLTKRCQEATGRPPARAIIHYKIEHAARSLRQSDLPIKELSFRLGFQNQYHFSRVFRRVLGVSPSHYREFGAGPRQPESAVPKVA